MLPVVCCANPKRITHEQPAAAPAERLTVYRYTMVQSSFPAQSSLIVPTIPERFGGSIKVRVRMATSTESVFETHRRQAFPVLEPSEVERLLRFGQRRCIADGGYLLRTGEIAFGMFVILSGHVVVAPRDPAVGRGPIFVHGPGGFVGELAQFSGHPALVEAQAKGPVEALILVPQALRNVLLEEADLGERIMRALILRRLGLLQEGIGGPVIVGRAADRNVLRLEGFLASNGHPYRRFDPDTDHAAQIIVERFGLIDADLPIVLSPNGEVLRNP